MIFIEFEKTDRSHKMILDFQIKKKYYIVVHNSNDTGKNAQ